MSCPIQSTPDGYRCLACGARWDLDDEPPACAEGPTVSVDTIEAPPTSRDGVAARLRRALTMQTGRGQDPLAVSITPNLARDILAHLERTP